MSNTTPYTFTTLLFLFAVVFAVFSGEGAIAAPLHAVSNVRREESLDARNGFFRHEAIPMSDAKWSNVGNGHIPRVELGVDSQTSSETESSQVGIDWPQGPHISLPSEASPADDDSFRTIHVEGWTNV
ncbi:hypothetical protein CERSUDRAFT_116737 [Gelatoporia subvermispora B]|uniref:Uncharacterized protein n=1 Tax=Ceriporiopsis subvermispora (strain B) TaxID=914234 RepID=M2PF76_CERS8|nr:hypothetical protein CERSUDRAFT_116737 [Gelatoporia subvermispora B]